MGPEAETTITPANLAVATARFESARDRYALAHARGSNILALRPVTESAELSASMLQLAEYSGRNSVISGTLPGFRAEVAIGAARAFRDASDSVVAAATEAVQTPGPLTGITRFWSSPDGDLVKTLTTGGLVVAHFFGQTTGNTADIIAHAAFASSAITAMDVVGVRGALEVSTRHVRNLPRRIAELMRRKASIDQATIDGSHEPLYSQLLFNQPDPGQILAGELEDRAEDAIGNNLLAHDIQRPPLVRHDAAYTSGLRSVIEDALRPFDPIQELDRSRRVSVLSKGLRTIAALGILAGAVGHYVANRPAAIEVPPVCPTITFPGLNVRTEETLGVDTKGTPSGSARTGVDKRAQFSGIARAKFFERATGRKFDHSPEDADQLERLIDEDRAGNLRIIDRVAQELKVANPQLRGVSTDSFEIRNPDGSGVIMVDLCPPHVDTIYDEAVKSPSR